MFIKKKALITTVSLLSLLLTSCGQRANSGNGSNTGDIQVDTDASGLATVRIYKNNDYSSNGRFVPADKVDLELNYNDLSGTLSNNKSVMPSLGDANLLVIPVHLPGGNEYKTDKVKSDIEKVFFGDKDDSSLGFKSVKQYYSEASYGKFNLSGTVTDWFDATTLVSNVKDITSGTEGTIVNKILRGAVDWAGSSQGINLKDFDNNEDGNIDGVYLVYDHLDWTTENYIQHESNPQFDSSTLNQAFWNFTYWDFYSESKNDKPSTSGFSWSSFDMMYTSYCERNKNDTPDLSDLSKIKLDSHTFIHEFGHLLGLDDYYSSSDSSYHPAGESTMMDQNIGDLDSYSKMLLGWVTPYVVYGTSEITITNVSKNSENSVIVIPSNYAEISQSVEDAIKGNRIDKFRYTFNPFSEYLMIDLYTPDGNNEQDTYGPYVFDRSAMANKVGVRIYHIDSRIFKCKVVDYMGGQKLAYVDGYVWDGQMLQDDEAILMPISNNMSESKNFQLPQSFDYFDQIRLLESSGINTFDKNGMMTNQTLYYSESKPFDIMSYGYQFFNGRYTYDDGNELPFKVKVLNVEDKGE